MKRLLKNNLLLSLMTVTVGFVTAFCLSGFTMYYSTVDDYIISSLISAGQSKILFLNFFLSTFLVWFQKIIGSINVFFLFQWIINFIALVCIHYVFIEKFRKTPLFLIAVIVFFDLLFTWPCLIALQYNQTTSTGFTAGSLLIIRYFQQNTSKNKFMLIFGIVFAVISALLRIQAVLPVSALCLLYLFSDIFVDIAKRYKETKDLKTILKNNVIRYLKPFLIYVCVLLAVFLLTVSSDWLKRQDSWYVEYESYNTARTRAIDYLGVEYDGNEEFYNSIGIFSANDLETVKSWSIDSDYSTTERFSKMADYAEKEEFHLRFSFNRIFDTLKEKISFIPIDGNIVLCGLAVCGIVILFVLYKIRSKIRYLFPAALLLMYLAFFVVFGISSPCFALMIPLAFFTVLTCLIFNRYHYFYCLAMTLFIVSLTVYQNFNRINFRVTFTYFIPVFSLLILWIDFRNITYGFRKYSVQIRTIYAVGSGVLCSIAFIISVSGILYADGQTYGFRNIQNNLYNYVLNTSSNLYVADESSVYRFYIYYDSPIKRPCMLNNLLYTGWRVGDETQIQVKEKFHIKHLYREMTERNDIYYVINPSELERMEEYFNNHYCDKGYKIVMTQHQIINGYGIYSVDKVKI